MPTTCGDPASFDSVTGGSAWPLFSGANQPAHRDLWLGLELIEAPLVIHAVAYPFHRVLDIHYGSGKAKRAVLVVPPLSGHFSILMRDLVVGLLARFRVLLIDWTNVRHVPLSVGTFGLETNIAGIVEVIRGYGPGLSVIGLCQGGVSALAAVSVLSADGSACVPSSLVLLATPVDPLANSTRVVRLLRQQPLSWFEHNSLGEVADRYEGRGRRVHPAEWQLWALATYLARRVAEGGELAQKVWADDGLDPARFPFLDLYSSIMDIDAQIFLDDIRCIYQERSLYTGGLMYGGIAIEPRAVTQTALMSVEGAWDDIAAPGQTSAVHGLCAALVDEKRHRLVVPRCGHFSLFHGTTWRREVLPVVETFLLTHVADRGPEDRQT